MKGKRIIFTAIFQNLFSDAIATSDVYPTEDLEYIVQAQRIPGSDYRYLLLYNPFLNLRQNITSLALTSPAMSI